MLYDNSKIYGKLFNDELPIDEAEKNLYNDVNQDSQVYKPHINVKSSRRKNQEIVRINSK